MTTLPLAKLQTPREADAPFAMESAPAGVEGDAARGGGSAAPSRAVRIVVLVILLPTLLASLYFGLIASDQYVAGGRFAIRAQGSPRMDAVGFLGLGASSSLSASDMYIVRDYIGSHQLLEDIKPYLDLRKIYSHPEADGLARFDPSLPQEEFLLYWRKMATLHYDTTSGLAELRVKAFTPEDARNIAERVLLLSEQLVNRLSERSRADSLALSQKEVDAAYRRVIASMDSLRDFSRQAQQIDPVGYARLRGEIQARLDGELISYQTQLEVLRKSLPEEAPGVQVLKRRIAVIHQQLKEEKESATASATGDSASDILSDYNRLQLEREFAEKAYLSSLASHESARVEVLRQARYLEAFVRPQLPQSAEYPRRLRSIAIVFVCSCLASALGGVFISAAKEHLQ